MNKKAAILGATGLIGSELLPLLLEDENYDEVWVYTRKPLKSDHPKLKQIIGDLLEEGAFDGLAVEDVFCCIGTTQAKTPDLSDYKNIDYGIPLRAAKAGVKGGMHQFLVVSSLGANAESKTFYLKVKGQMEQGLRKMAIPKLYIFRPSLLLGKREEFRMMERIGQVAVNLFRWAIPAKYKGIKAARVARAMHEVANSLSEQVVYESDDILKLTQPAKD